MSFALGHDSWMTGTDNMQDVRETVDYVDVGGGDRMHLLEGRNLIV